MVLQRKVFQRILEWKDYDSNHSALLLIGAKRVGKTRAVEEFAYEEYESFVFIDCAHLSSMVRNAFEYHLKDLDSFFMILQAEYNVTLCPGKSLVVFDNIHQYPAIRNAIGTLVKYGKYHFVEIADGSVSSNGDAGIKPSESETLVEMHPFDFEEFCAALGEKEILKEIRDCYNKHNSMDEFSHQKALLLFKQYMLVGGMPQSITAFLEQNRTFSESEKQKRLILDDYRNAIKQSGMRNQAAISSVFERIPNFLSRNEKRIRLSNIESSSGSFASSLNWLKESMIISESRFCENPVEPESGSEKVFTKCYLDDTGLLLSQAFSDSEMAEGQIFKQVLSGHFSMSEGMLMENAVAQCLTAAGYGLRFFNRYCEEKHRNDIGIDFIIPSKHQENKIIPIVVKASKRYRTGELERFIDLYENDIDQAVIIHTNNLVIKGRIVCIPCYMTFCL